MSTVVPAPLARGSVPCIEQILGLGTRGNSPHRGAGEGGGRSWLRVTRRGRTRFLLPTDSDCRRAALELVASPLNAAGISLLLALRRWMPTERGLSVAGEQAPLDELAAPLFSPGERLRYAVYFGTESVFRKWTVQVLDSGGRARAYVKIGFGPRAGEAIRNEASVLEALRGDGVPPGSVPEVLALTTRWGAPVSVLSAPPAGTSRAAPFPSGAVVEFARRLFRSRVVRAPWVDSPVRAEVLECARRVADRGEASAAELLWRADAALGRDFGSEPLPHGRSHGDFLPWNLRLTPEPFVFDWEWARPRLPQYDLYHYLAFGKVVGRGRAGDGVRAWVRSPEAREVLGAADPGELPFGPADGRWWRAYLVQAFAFYAETSSAAGILPRTSRLMRNLMLLLREELKEV